MYYHSHHTQSSQYTGTSSTSSASSNQNIPESKEFHRVRDAAREISSVSKPLRRVIATTENWIKTERSIHVASTRYAQLCLAISQNKSCSHRKCHASLGKGLVEAAKHTHQLPNITAALVLTPCRFFEGLAEESCEIEKNRELLVQDYMDALDAKRVAQDFQASGRFTLTPEEAKKADKRSEEADRLVKNSKERLTDLAKSMLMKSNRFDPQNHRVSYDPSSVLWNFKLRSQRNSELHGRMR